MATRSLLLSTAMLAAASVASAITIPITNASFEADAQANVRGFIRVAPTGWTRTGGQGGVFRPSAFEFDSSGIQGLQTVAANNIPDALNTSHSNGGDLSQILAESLTGTAGITYTLSAYVGDRFDTAFPSYTLQLLAGGTILAFATDPVIPLDGAFAQASLIYTTTGAEAEIGQALEIRLINNGNIQINWDNVALDAEAAVPEPSTVLMFGGGLLAVLLLRRRAQQR